jgi:lysyl-tRNA synthetase class 2
MELTELEKQRVEKLERLQAAGVEPYPRRAKRTHTIAEALAALEQAEATSTESQVAVAGRLRSIRVMGKVTFAHIEDGSGSIQLFLRLQEVGEDTYETFKQNFDLGDFVSAEGQVVYTRTGEPSVLVQKIQMLSKAISPLPWPPTPKCVRSFEHALASSKNCAAFSMATTF